MSGASSIPPEGFAFRDRTTDHDVAGQRGAVGEVSSGEDSSGFASRRGEGGEEFSNPIVVAPINAAPINAAPINAAPINAAPIDAGPSGNAQGDEGEAGFAAHRRYIAEAAAHSHATDVGCGMGCAAEMDVFQEQIRGEEEVFRRAFGPVDRAIVTDTQDDPGAGGDDGFRPEPIGDLAFAAQAKSLAINNTG